MGRFARAVGWALLLAGCGPQPPPPEPDGVIRSTRTSGAVASVAFAAPVALFNGRTVLISDDPSACADLLAQRLPDDRLARPVVRGPGGQDRPSLLLVVGQGEGSDQSVLGTDLVTFDVGGRPMPPCSPHPEQEPRRIDAGPADAGDGGPPQDAGQPDAGAGEPLDAGPVPACAARLRRPFNGNVHRVRDSDPERPAGTFVLDFGDLGTMSGAFRPERCSALPDLANEGTIREGHPCAAGGAALAPQALLALLLLARRRR